MGLCEKNLVGKPLEERKSLQLSSCSPSSSVAVDLHTLVEKAHGSELFFKYLLRDSATKHQMFSANKEIYCYLGVSYDPVATGTYDVSKMYQNLGLSYHMYVPDIQKYHPRYPLVVTMRRLRSKTLPPLCRFSEPTCYQ